MVFCPEILVQWWGLAKVFCCSVNVHEVVVLCSGGGDTSIELDGDPKT